MSARRPQGSLHDAAVNAPQLGRDRGSDPPPRPAREGSGTSDPAEYIEKVRKRGTIGKKRKAEMLSTQLGTALQAAGRLFERGWPSRPPHGRPRRHRRAALGRDIFPLAVGRPPSLLRQVFASAVEMPAQIVSCHRTKAGLLGAAVI